MLIDGESKKSGSLFEDFDPPINPPEEMDDADDKKPSDWVENPKCAPATDCTCRSYEGTSALAGFPHRTLSCNIVNASARCAVVDVICRHVT